MSSRLKRVLKSIIAAFVVTIAVFVALFEKGFTKDRVEEVLLIIVFWIIIGITYLIIEWLINKFKSK